MEMQLYIANLSLYNSGEMMGEWFDLPVDYENVKKTLKIGEEYGEDNGEEYIILDYEFPIKIGEYESLEKINEWAEGIESLPEFIIDNLDEAVDYEPLEEIIDNQGENFMLYPDVSTSSDLGYEIIESVGGIAEMDKSKLESYFNYQGFGRDVLLESQYVFTGSEYIVYNG